MKKTKEGLLITREEIITDAHQFIIDMRDVDLNPSNTASLLNGACQKIGFLLKLLEKDEK